MLTIALIDRQPIMRFGLTCYLKNYYRDMTIIEADDIVSLFQSNPKQSPDLIIWGTHDEAKDTNFSILTKTQNLYPATSVIIYDDRLINFNILYYSSSLVDGYLLKQNDPEELIVCVNKVLTGKKYISQELINFFPEVFLREKNSFRPKQNKLTNRENQIAEFLCAGRKTSWIAEKLVLKMSTISTFKSIIFKKLKVSNIVELKACLN